MPEFSEAFEHVARHGNIISAEAYALWHDLVDSRGDEMYWGVRSRFELAKKLSAIDAEAAHIGLKAIAVYRDGCKRSQPLTTKETTDEAQEVTHKPVRRELADERPSLTHKFKVGGHTGYMTIGLYPDGSPAELFLVVGKEGGVVRGLLDGFATSVSLALQYGVPLRALVDRFTNMSFEPAGWTPNPDVPYAKSILDYVFRYLALKYLDDEELSDSALAQQQLPLLASAQAEQSVREAAGPLRQTGIDGQIGRAHV